MHLIHDSCEDVIFVLQDGQSSMGMCINNNDYNLV